MKIEEQILQIKGLRRRLKLSIATLSWRGVSGNSWATSFARDTTGSHSTGNPATRRAPHPRVGIRNSQQYFSLYSSVIPPKNSRHQIPGLDYRPQNINTAYPCVIGLGTHTLGLRYTTRSLAVCDNGAQHSLIYDQSRQNGRRR